MHKTGVKGCPADGGQELSQPLDMRPRVWFNEDMQSRNFIIPGLIAVLMMSLPRL